MHQFFIPVKQHFSFQATVYSHGWADLSPFNTDREKHELTYACQLSTGRVVEFKSQADSTGILINIEKKPAKSDLDELTEKVRRIFRVDEDFSGLNKLIQKHPETRWIAKKRAGRLLRCASLWEDMVKMLCTTNCTWHLTKLMVNNLVTKAGDGKSFPTPEQIYRYDENFLRNTVKMGYRSPYLLGMAKDITEGRIDLLNWENWTGTTSDLYKEMRKVKGLGEYAVSNLLKLLGRYDYLGIDSWGRRKFADVYHNGSTVTDKQIISFYNRFGSWSGLIFLLDLTQDIYDSVDK